MSLIPSERIEKTILLIRGQKVMLDEDLAELYGVAVKVLNQAVRRNQKRFPSDFMIQLTKNEYDEIRSRLPNLKSGRGRYRKYLPYAFTEQGVAMLSTVLNSERSIQVNVEIMRTFVRLRQILASHSQLARKVEQIEKKYDSNFKVVFEAIHQLMEPPRPKRKRIGF